MSKVSIYKGDDRYQNIYESLESIKSDILKSIQGKEKIVIKVNLCWPLKKLAVTNVQAVKAVLNWLKENNINQKMTIAEAPFWGALNIGLRAQKYLKILKHYNINYVDLNSDETEEFVIQNSKLNLDLKVNLAKTILDADYIISIAPPKTHNEVVVTLGIKNVTVGSMVSKRNKLTNQYSRSHIHCGYPQINYIIAGVAKRIKVNLNVLDGFQAMEGDGPVMGKPVNLKMALAGLDSVAVDSVAASLMGFNPQDVGYLYLANKFGLGEINLNKIELVGNVDVNQEKIKFIPHKSYEKQLTWKEKSNFN